MSRNNNPQYRTTVQDEHWRDEEFQWVRILTSGNAARGMVLLYIQKACTAFHEFEPAFRAGAVNADRLEFFRRRLAQRVLQVLTTMENNRLGQIEGASELREILHRIGAAGSVGELASLGESVHSVNHMLLDALEA